MRGLSDRTASSGIYSGFKPDRVLSPHKGVFKEVGLKPVSACACACACVCVCVCVCVWVRACARVVHACTAHLHHDSYFHVKTYS